MNQTIQNTLDIDTKSLSELLFIFNDDPSLAGDQMMQILSGATDSDEMETWARIERADAIEVCRQIINLIHAAHPLTREGVALTSEENLDLCKALDELDMERIVVVIDVLLKLLGAAMSGRTSDLVWGRAERSNATHFCRHIVNLLLSHYRKERIR